ncbi:MAG: lipocalin family protein [Flavobacterium sp.]
MKQTVFALAFVAIAFASCKNQTEAPVVEETTTTETVTEQAAPVVNTNAELVGTWTQLKPGSADKTVTHGMELKEDGTVLPINVDGMKFSKWKVVDNTIVFEGEMIGNDPSTVEISIFKYEIINGKTLKLDLDGVIEEFTKQ